MCLPTQVGSSASCFLFVYYFTDTGPQVDPEFVKSLEKKLNEREEENNDIILPDRGETPPPPLPELSPSPESPLSSSSPPETEKKKKKRKYRGEKWKQTQALQVKYPDLDLHEIEDRVGEIFQDHGEAEMGKFVGGVWSAYLGLNWGTAILGGLRNEIVQKLQEVDQFYHKCFLALLEPGALCKKVCPVHCIDCDPRFFESPFVKGRRKNTAFTAILKVQGKKILNGKLKLKNFADLVEKRIEQMLVTIAEMRLGKLPPKYVKLIEQNAICLFNTCTCGECKQWKPEDFK